MDLIPLLKSNIFCPNPKKTFLKILPLESLFLQSKKRGKINFLESLQVAVVKIFEQSFKMEPSERDELVWELLFVKKRLP